MRLQVKSEVKFKNKVVDVDKEAGIRNLNPPTHNGECKAIQANRRGNLEDQNGENCAFPSPYTTIVTLG